MDILFSFNMYTYSHILSFEVHHQLSMSIDLPIPTCFANSYGQLFQLKKIYLQYLEFRDPSLGLSSFAKVSLRGVKKNLRKMCLRNHH